MFWFISLALLVTSLLIFLPTLVKYQIRNFKSPLRKLPGPRSRSWLYGNTKEIIERGGSVAWDEWVSTYGKTFTFRYPTVFNTLVLFTADPRAVKYAITHLDEFQKPPGIIPSQDLAGESLLFAEGETHRKQRRIMNPAFGPANIRSLTPIFIQKAFEVRDIWVSQLNENDADVINVDVDSYMRRVVFDIFGLAGFGYEFGSLQSKEDEFGAAFHWFMPGGSVPINSSYWIFRPILMAFVPMILKLPLPFPGVKRLQAAKKVIHRVCGQLVAERKSALLQEQSSGTKENLDTTGRDLLSLLVRANFQDADCMSDSAVRSQIINFLFSGHVTTSAAKSWTLFGLSKNLEAQRKLREELLTLPTDDPTMHDLEALPYLDMVIRESLRLYSPIHITMRAAMKDTVLPMSDGSSISMAEGERLLIPIHVMNTDKDIWGGDALEFKPERWKSPPEAISENPGVWSNIMSFLDGPRACIGYQFTILEMKCLLFALVRKFEFSLVLPAEDIVWWTHSIARRPFVKGEERDGPKLPLYVKIHVPEA